MAPTLYSEYTTPLLLTSSLLILLFALSTQPLPRHPPQLPSYLYVPTNKDT